MLRRNGILLVDKPQGVTSFAVVDHVRRSLLNFAPELDPRRRDRRRRGGPRPPRFKCGHAGTLDPLATGLLVVLVGKGSRLSPFLIGLNKTYTATIRFGSGTDTLDSEGTVVSTAPIPQSVAVVTSVLEGFRGEIQQVPPVISALKRDGQPLYKLARSGQPVAEPEPRSVTIGRLDILGSRWPGTPTDEMPAELDLLVDCSSGTYIRSLARDIARAAGSEGHIVQLRRLSVGPFAVDAAVSGVMNRDGSELAGEMCPLATALPHLPVLTLGENEAGAVRNGAQPLPEWMSRLTGRSAVAGDGAGLFCMLDEEGELVAVGRQDAIEAPPRTAAVIPLDTGAAQHAPDNRRDEQSCD